jgi:UDP-hydrolysing UDP-N-acetyl-D-glucosamine 2-epimerase
MREIAILSTSRADFGIYRPVLDRMAKSKRLRARLIVSGSHLEEKFGRTEREIRSSGYPIYRRFRCLTGEVASSMARMMEGMSDLLRSWRPDVMLVLGDRFEMLAGALAAVPHFVPLAHLHGGEVTRGAIDDSFRHAISKISHLHFTSTEEAARRLRRMGEEPWRITISGAPALDRLDADQVKTSEDYLLVTYHPVTREPGREVAQAEALITALRRVERPCVVTAPNADPGNEPIRKRLRRFCRQTPTASYYESLGADAYFRMMSSAAAMVGNSSSGILEAPSFRLPVVNIGTRQDGRLRAKNVIDCGYDAGGIVRAIRKALSPVFRESLRGMKNPYGDGRASERIVKRLETVPLDDRLLRKEFAES